MKFSVTLLQKRLYETTIEVEADGRDQAETKALDQAGGLDFTEHLDNEYSVSLVQETGR